MRLLGQMALVALVIGTSVTVSATERVDLSLVAGGALGWSFVPILQLLTGILFVWGGPRPRVRALERYFDTHWAWSLWILITHAGYLVVPWLRGYSPWVAATMLVPIAWTVRLLYTFARQHLGLGQVAALRRVALHQALTLVIAVIYVQFAVALWPRALGVLR